jgi:sugar/nucleoside kinase (ribokinase family)
MSLLVTGSIGIDDVKTPYGEVQGVYGGSAVYFSFAAKVYAPVRFVGVVGEDFPDDFRSYLEQADIDVAGLEVRKGSKTFRWSGSYEGAMNEAETRDVELNVLAEAGPKIPEQFTDSAFVFLANTHPLLQQDLIGQLKSPKLIVADTMNLWIMNERDALLKTLGMVNGAILNDGEARLLTEETNLVLAGRKILEYGPEFAVIKKGEHGVMLITKDAAVALPAYPTDSVKDPTGAGDSFAGGMMGYLASQKDCSLAVLKKALAVGTITASFTIEDFSLRRIEKVTTADVEARLKQYADMLSVL